YAACRALGVAPATVMAGFRSFPGLPHRQRLLAVIDGVSYVNDSKATNADAAAKALACYEHIYWIAGGRGKEGGLQGLEPFYPRIAEAFLIGEAEADFARTLQPHVKVRRCGDLATAFEAASAAARQDNSGKAVVLLAPACASFDQFPDFEARGAAFGALVEALPGEREGLEGSA
ncbi:MAG: glutamate ligase domain-containing protein, partial [Kiloniellales bacterium]